MARLTKNKREASADSDVSLAAKRIWGRAENATQFKPVPLFRQNTLEINTPPPNEHCKMPSANDDDDDFQSNYRVDIEWQHLWPKQSIDPRLKPSTAFHFDIFELPDPDDISHAFPGSLCWATCDAPPTEAHTLAAAKLYFVHQFVRHNNRAISSSNVTINFIFLGEGKWHVEAVFKTVESYIAGRTAPLKWNKKDLKLAGGSAPLGTDMIMLKMTGLRATTDQYDFFKSFQKSLASVVYPLGFWMEFSTCVWSKLPLPLPPKVFTGSIKVLARFREGQGPNQLPGVLNYDGLAQELRFRGRDYCETEPLTLHSFKDCTKKSMSTEHAEVPRSKDVPWVDLSRRSA